MLIHKALLALALLLGAAMPAAAEYPCDGYNDLCPRAKALQLCESRRETTHACGTTWGHETCAATEHVANESVPLGHFDACVNTDIRAGWVGWYRYYYDYPAATPDPERDRGPPKCDKGCFGDPVNAMTGNKFETRSEFIGAGPFPLKAEWTYNATGTSSALASQDLIFGRNRSHFYARRVVNGMEDELAVAMVARPDGKTIRFYKGADTGWSSNGDDPGTLRLETSPDGASMYRFDDGHGGSELFTQDGRLRMIRGPQGDEQTLHYDLQGRLARVIDRYNRALEFEYLGARVHRILQPDGYSITFTYSSNGDLEGVLYPDGARTEYRYDEAGYSDAASNAGLLTGVIHDGQRYSSTKYDSYGRATSTWLGNGVDRYDFKYSGTGAVLTYFEVTLPSGGTKYGPVRVKQGASMPDYLYSSRPCSGCAYSWVTYKYDKNSNMDVENIGGTITDYDYDARGLLIQKIESSNAPATKRTEQTTWHPSYPVPLERKLLDANGVLVVRRTWAYNDRGQLLTSSEYEPAIDAVRTTSYTYCEQAEVASGACPLPGLLLAVDGPRTDVSDVERYEYRTADHPECDASSVTCFWRKGDLWKVTNAKGQVTETLRYDGAGRVLSAKESNGVVTDYAYDPRGRLTGRTTRASN